MQVDQPHRQDDEATFASSDAPLLQVARQQQHERQREVPEHEQQRDVRPSRRGIRSKKNGISSGRLPAQMIRNCENEK